MQFRDSFYQFVPPWLSTDDAEKYFYTLEFMRDLLMEKANQAVKIRLPGQGDRSQIPFLAYDRQLVQGPLESDAAFIERLKNAIPTWNESGSALAVLGQLQAYTQPQASSPYIVDLPKFVIVSNPRSTGAGLVNTWCTINYHDPIGVEPLISTVAENFDWDGNDAATWRAWLVLYQYLDAPTLSGTGATTVKADHGSFVVADWGEEVAGVWVPKTTGTPHNAPFLTIAGLAGLLPEHVGSMLTISGSGTPGNNGTFQIVQVIDVSTCVVVNPSGVAGDAGLSWEIASYPWMPPNLALGSPGQVWGDGEGSTPLVDTGANVRGVWQPTAQAGPGERPTYAWGVRVDPLEIETIRGLVRTWKSAGTYYPNIIISYGAGEYDRTSAGTGNPDGSFGSVGMDVGGTWVPTRTLVSSWDCYCQGTGRAVACSLENMT